MATPRIMIAACRGGSGKTFLSIGILAAWRAQGKRVIPFKKGPDYIDAGWLTLAAGRPCHNLDTFLIPPQGVIDSFLLHSRGGDIAVIEGNRGLYDGLDHLGSTSSAEIAKLLDTPVILVINSTKTTRTMAAVVLGCMHLDPEVSIKGVILNRVAGARHETIQRKSIEYYCGIPVVGAVPKLTQRFPERHMGLVPTMEHSWAKDSVEDASRAVSRHIDLTALEAIATDVRAPEEKRFPKTPVFDTFPDSPVCPEDTPGREAAAGLFPQKPKIGVIRDSAFQFYYPENLDALSRAGAEMVFFSPLSQVGIPGIDALYIGGGFPETHAAALSKNVAFMEALRSLVEAGLPVYAECGGLMYLGQSLVLKEGRYPMAGVLPVTFGFSKRPQGHGYTIVEVIAENPFYPLGQEIRGHEFHYSSVLEWGGKDTDLVFSMKRGTGFLNGKDGVCYKNVLATYTHIHALGAPSWAMAMVERAMDFASAKSQGDRF
ncbi:MAG: cobyrinate a,c-diamide synthase [Deltaproteobacteria bacterium]|nr:cobyrinate a,c-diamide synthase [Deltaproteobacteria bacterium]MBW2042994.1 cobyrinate a,c-diamide synthase [Deltaproteobacteria bacterium]MBW2131468.1 cobyrinate a,c-diamide synthase [Deltaproteobacteria bacterium]